MNMPEIKNVIIFDDQVDYEPKEITLTQLMNWGQML